MNKKPLFSIIIPVKGRLKYVKEALTSLEKQKSIAPASLEIIVVEEKNPQEIIRNEVKKLFPEVKIVLNRHENYAGGSRNSGLEKAQGEYIVFLDSDDQLRPDFLYKMYQTLEKDKNAAAVVCFSKAIFAPGYDFKGYLKWHLLMFARDISLLLFYFFHKTYLVPSAFYLCQLSHMMFKKEKIRDLKFNCNYRYGGEDWDFINHAQDKGLIRIVPHRLTIFRYSQTSLTVLPAYKKLKWQSYLDLAGNLSSERKQSVYYKLFLNYISLFR